MYQGSRIILPWKEVKSKIHKKLQYVKDLKSEDEKDHVPFTVYLQDKSEIIYSVSHYPNALPAMAFYRLGSSNCFIAFDWGSSAEKKKIKMWLQDASNVSMISQKEYLIEAKARTIKICHVACRHIFITYSDDQFLRLYADQSQQLKLLGAVMSLYVVRTMCYSEQTAELITGSTGAILFWVFNDDLCSVLSVSKVMEIKNGFFVNDIILERGCRYMVALCENLVKVFDCQKKLEIRSIGEEKRPSLTCFTIHWVERYVYTGDVSGFLRVWSSDTCKRISAIKAHMGAISSVVINLTVHILLTASKDHLVKEWSLSTLELLRSISLEEEVLHVQLVNENVFYCCTTYTFSIWNLNAFYKLFNATGSSVKNMKRVQSLPGKARLLVSTDDGIIRCLSPVTGELLFLTWPFLVLEKALDYVYDPEIEELFVITGSADIYVIDTSICPCFSKYIMITSENKDDVVVCLASSRQMLIGKASCLIFSGYMSGQIRLISPHDYCMDEFKIHSSAIVSMQCLSNDDPQMVSTELRLLCSYGMDNYIYLSNIVMKAKTVTLELLTSIFCKCVLQHIILVPEWLCTITEKNTIRLWKIQELLSSKKQHSVTKRKDSQNCRITSLDYCPTLGLFLTGYQDGIVQVWNTKNNVLVEFKISQNFKSTCFANLRADLLVAFHNNIYVIPSIQYLQDEQLKILAAENIIDDSIEDPFPFLPSIFLSFDTVLMPQYLHLGQNNCKEMNSVKSTKCILTEKNVVKELESKYNSKRGKQAKKYALGDKPLGLCMMASQDSLLSIQKQQKSDIPQDQKSLPSLYGFIDHKSETLELEPVSVLKLHLPFFGKWAIAPDGYLPNSVIRVPLWPQGTPDYHLDFLDKRKEDQIRDQPGAKDLLTQIASHKWLWKKMSSINLKSVIEALLERMAQASMTKYKYCTRVLTAIVNTYTTPQNLKTSIARRLYEDTCDKDNLKRLEAWSALDNMHLLSLDAVNYLATTLLDSDVQLRDKARFLLASSAKITTKKSLLKILRKNAIMHELMALPSEHKKEKTETPEQAIIWKNMASLLQQLNKNLTSNLQLISMKDIKPQNVIKTLNAINLPIAIRLTDATKPPEIIKSIKAIKRAKAVQYTEDINVMADPMIIKITNILKTTEATKPTELIMETVKPMDDFELTEVTSTTGMTKDMDIADTTDVTRLINATEVMEAIKQSKPMKAQKPMKKSTLSVDTLGIKLSDDRQDKLAYANQIKPNTWLKERTVKKCKSTKKTQHEEKTDIWHDRKIDKWHKEMAEVPKKGMMVDWTGEKTKKEKVKKCSYLWPGEQTVKGDQWKAKKPNQRKKSLVRTNSTLTIYRTEVKLQKPPSEVPQREGKEKRAKATELKNTPVDYLTNNSKMTTNVSHEVLMPIIVPSAELYAISTLSLEDRHWRQTEEPPWFKIDPNVHYDTDHTRWKEHLYKLIEHHGFRSRKMGPIIDDLINGHRNRLWQSSDKSPSDDPVHLQTAKDIKGWEGINPVPEMKDTLKMSAISLSGKEQDNLWPRFKMKHNRDIIHSSTRGKLWLPSIYEERGRGDEASVKTLNSEYVKGEEEYEGRQETQLERESRDSVFGRQVRGFPESQELSGFTEGQETHFYPLPSKISILESMAANNFQGLVSSFRSLRGDSVEEHSIRDNSFYALNC